MLAVITVLAVCLATPAIAQAVNVRVYSRSGGYRDKAKIVWTYGSVTNTSIGYTNGGLSSNYADFINVPGYVHYAQVGHYYAGTYHWHAPVYSCWTNGSWTYYDCRGFK